jgi:hypothetical protein
MAALLCAASATGDGVAVPNEFPAAAEAPYPRNAGEEATASHGVLGRLKAVSLTAPDLSQHRGTTSASFQLVVGQDGR